jgi:hypothetical protein
MRVLRGALIFLMDGIFCCFSKVIISISVPASFSYTSKKESRDEEPVYRGVSCNFAILDFFMLTILTPLASLMRRKG